MTDFRFIVLTFSESSHGDLISGRSLMYFVRFGAALRGKFRSSRTTDYADGTDDSPTTNEHKLTPIKVAEMSYEKFASISVYS